MIDKSLVVADTSASPRYRLLDTTRAFAMERMVDAGERERILERHAYATLKVFERSTEQKRSMNGRARRDLFLPDLGNLRAALEWAVAAESRGEFMIALVGASAWLWQRAGSWREGADYCERAIARLSSQTPASREARLQMQHAVARPQQRTAAGLAAISRAIDLYREAGDRRGLFDALNCRTAFLCTLHRTKEAEISCDKARSLVDKDWGSSAQQSLAFAESVILMRRGRWSEAQRFCEEVARLDEVQGDEDELVGSLTNVAYVALCSGDLPKAITAARKVLDRVPVENLREHPARGYLLSILGAALVESDRHDEALRSLGEARESLRRTGDVSSLLAHCSLLALKLGRVVESAYLLGRAKAGAGAGGRPHAFSEQRAVDAVSKRLRESMPEQELSRLLALGTLMSDEDALNGILQ